MDLELSDQELMLEDSNLESNKTSEDEVMEKSEGENPSEEEKSGEEEKSSDDPEAENGNGEEEEEQLPGPSSRLVPNSVPADPAHWAAGSRTGTGPDSMDANAAERIKSEIFGRLRKQVNRFKFESTSSKGEDVLIPVGAGVKLQEIPFIAEQINKHRAADLLKVHRFIFGRTGVHSEVKKHMRQFSGFGFVKGSVEYEKKKQTLNKMEKVGRDVLCDCFGLSKSGPKESVIERVMEFLMTPSADSVKGKGNPTRPTGKGKSAATSTKTESPAKSSAASGDDDASGEQSEEEKKDAKPKAKKTVKKSKKSPLKPTADVSEENPEENKKNVEKPKKKAVAAKKPKKSAPKPMEDDEGKEKKQSKKRKKDSNVSTEEESSKPKKRAKPAKKIPVKEAIADSTSAEADSITTEIGNANGFKTAEKKPSPTKGKGKAKPIIVPSFNVKKKKGNAKAKASPKKKVVLDSHSDEGRMEEEKEEASAKEQDLEGEGQEEMSSSDSGDFISEETIKALVEKIVADSDINTTSIKGVMEKLLEKLPTLDIDKYKSFVKNIVNEIIIAETDP